MFVEIGRTHPALFDPVGVVAFLDQPIPVLAFQILVIATLACNVFFILGWQYRYSGPACALLLLGVLCYRNSWSMIYHSDNVLVLHALILGLTRAADTVSLDAFRRSRSASRAESKSGTASDRRSGESWQYGWPIQLMCAVTVITYFLAGVAKVAGPLSWSWGSGEALRSQIAVDAMRKELPGSVAPPLAFSLYDEVLLFTVLGFGSLILELGAPAAILHKRLGHVWAISAFMMHWGIFFIMGINFRYQLSGVIFAPFLRIERLTAWFQARKVRKLGETASRREALVLFDGVCNVCNGTVQFILQRDSNALFQFAPLQSQTATEMLRRFQLPTDSLDTIVLVEREHVHTKSSAILRIFKELAGFWPVLYVLILIPKPIRDFMYSAFAKRRYHWFGKQESCSLPPKEVRARFLE